jgi:hypothetical protein
MKAVSLFFIGLFLTITTCAQEKFDTIYMKSSEINIGTISAINDGTISFTYKGEKLGYTFKKNDIEKIVFSSGRVENINNPGALRVTKSTADHHNRIAVLPFGFINTNQETNVEMGYKIQDECYTIISNKVTTLTVQDPSTTNALLGKAGVTSENIRNFTMTELCDILGVEYLVRGTISSNITSTTSSGSASYDAKSGNSSGKTGTSAKSSGSVYSSSSTQENFKTSVLMEIYTDDGRKIFGQDRTSFWTTADAYKTTLQYLMKKSPLYEK